MKMLLTSVSDLLSDALKRAFPDIEDKIAVTEATNEKFGHYQCNSAMSLAKSLKKSPQEIAKTLVSFLEDKEKILEKVEIANPGFINITLSLEFLAKEINLVLADKKRLGIPLSRKEKVVVDFSCPNIAKEMHVGHLRSTIIGDCIARLFEFLGYDVLRLNHLGDWGTAFGMLIAYMQETALDVLEGKKQATLPDLMHWYRSSKKRFDEDDEFKTKAREMVVLLQRGEPNILKAWTLICDISKRAYLEVYQLLDVTLIDRGESFYNPMLAPLVEDLEKRGVVTISDGAKCIFIEGHTIPLMLQKSDGGYGYDTTDMAAMHHRITKERADRIIIVTDSGQTLHFQLIYEASLKAHYLDPKKVRFDHVPFGLVLGQDGKKFKTRSGEVEKLIDLIVAAKKEALRILHERGSDLSENEIDNLANVLSIDAIKYADLASNRINDYQFSYERMLKFEGNTAPFILYSYVRIQGIKRKIPNLNMDELEKTHKIELTHPSEVNLVLHLLRFSQVLNQVAETLLPHLLTEYLYRLAEKFNVFFRDCQVIGSPHTQSRLLLCEVTARTLEQGLHILGLKTVEKM